MSRSPQTAPVSLSLRVAGLGGGRGQGCSSARGLPRRGACLGATAVPGLSRGVWVSPCGLGPSHLLVKCEGGRAPCWGSEEPVPLGTSVFYSRVWFLFKILCVCPWVKAAAVPTWALPPSGLGGDWVPSEAPLRLRCGLSRHWVAGQREAGGGRRRHQAARWGALRPCQCAALLDGRAEGTLQARPAVPGVRSVLCRELSAAVHLGKRREGRRVQAQPRAQGGGPGCQALCRCCCVMVGCGAPRPGSCHAHLLTPRGKQWRPCGGRRAPAGSHGLWGAQRTGPHPGAAVLWGGARWGSLPPFPQLRAAVHRGGCRARSVLVRWAPPAPPSHPLLSKFVPCSPSALGPRGVCPASKSPLGVRQQVPPTLATCCLRESPELSAGRKPGCPWP